MFWPLYSLSSSFHLVRETSSLSSVSVPFFSACWTWEGIVVEISFVLSVVLTLFHFPITFSIIQRDCLVEPVNHVETRLMKTPLKGSVWPSETRRAENVSYSEEEIILLLPPPTIAFLSIPMKESVKVISFLPLPSPWQDWVDPALNPTPSVPLDWAWSTF